MTTPHPFPLSIDFGTLTGGLDSFPFAYGRYHPYTDSRVCKYGIRSLIAISTSRRGHHTFSSSTSILLNLEARPKPISGRTSYLRVRLEFHRYPQVIPSRFLVSGFGPPVRVTEPSSCSWIDHSVSGLLHHTKSPYSDSLSLRLRIFYLTSHATLTRRFILQKARHHPLTDSDFL